MDCDNLVTVERSKAWTSRRAIHIYDGVHLAQVRSVRTGGCLEKFGNEKRQLDLLLGHFPNFRLHYNSPIRTWIFPTQQGILKMQEIQQLN